MSRSDDALGMAAIRFDALQPSGSATVAALDGQHSLVGRFGRHRIATGPQLIGFGNQLLHGLLSAPLEIELVGQIIRIAGDCLLKLLQRGLIAALVEFIQTLTVHSRTGAGDHQ